MNEKVALITGANKGIGFGIAKYLGLSGWKVIIGARNAGRAASAIQKLTASGIDVLGWVNIELKDIAGIEQAAMDMEERLIRQMADQQEVTEALKAKDQMMWVQKMNNIRNAAREIVLHDIIYAV